MPLNKDLFDKRVDEVNQYFVFLKSIEDDCLLFFQHKKTHSKKKLSQDIVPILKANFLLVLYNLMESVIIDSIKQVYDFLSGQSLTYRDSIDEIQALWIQLNHKNFKIDQDGISKGEQIRNTICNIESEIVNLSFDASYFKTGGNIDKQKIEKIAKEHGISGKIRRKAGTGNKLHDVKSKRNDLAHGNFSFGEIGRHYTIQQLDETKNDIIKYIESIIQNIDKYIDNKEYQRRT